MQPQQPQSNQPSSSAGVLQQSLQQQPQQHPSVQLSSQSGEEAYLRAQMDKALRDTKVYRQRVEQLEKENQALKKSVYDLSARLGIALTVSSRPKPGVQIVTGAVSSVKNRYFTIEHEDNAPVEVENAPDRQYFGESISTTDNAAVPSQLTSGPSEGSSSYHIQSIDSGMEPSFKRMGVELSHEQLSITGQSKKYLHHKFDFKGHTGAIYALQYSPCGKYLASGSFDQTVRIWDVFSSQSEVNCFRKHTLNISDLAWSHDSSELLSGAYDRTCKTWDIESGKMSASFEVEGFVLCVAYNSQNTNYLYHGTSRKVLGVIDKRKPESSLIIRNDAMINTLHVSNAGNYILTGDSGGYIKIWDIRANNQCLQSHLNEAGKKPISHISTCRQNSEDDEPRFIAVNSYDNVLRVYDRGMDPPKSFMRLMHCLVGHKVKNWPIKSAFYEGPLIPQLKQTHIQENIYDTEDIEERDNKHNVRHKTGKQLLLATGSSGPYAYLFLANMTSQPIHPSGSTISSSLTSFGLDNARSVASGTIQQSTAESASDELKHVPIGLNTVDNQSSPYHELIQRVEGHSDRVYATAFHPKDILLATGSADSTVKFVQYSTALPGTERPGQTAVYRHRDSPDRIFLPEHNTLYENFQHGLNLSADKSCLGWRTRSADGRPGPYQWISYRQVNQRLTDFGSGLLEIYKQHIAPHRLNGDGGQMTHWNLGLYSINRPEWVIAEQAANAYSLVTVALYDTLGADTLEFTINHAELGIIACSFDKMPSLLRVASKCVSLKVIISMDPLKDDNPTSILRGWAADRGILLFDFSIVEKMGSKYPLKHIPPKPHDIATICYTSGTTGDPKGAMLMHQNFVSGGLASRYNGIYLEQSDIHISYLPLAHCFERILQVAILHVGGSIGFYRGDVLELVEDIAALKPTIFPSVPRLFNRIYGKLQEGTVKAPGVRGALFRRALSDKLNTMRNGGGIHHWLWDPLLFTKVAAVLGGNVRIMITGSAPISAEVLTFLRLCFSCEVLEGYGQTEAAAGSTITFPGDYTPGQVGAPLICNEFKLVDVPDMGYLSTDKIPRGEICFRGSNVMKGYYKDEKKTKETIDGEGWLHTGDIGMLLPSGTLSIIDRKKNIFKLAQGEYVAPEKLEAALLKSEYIQQIFVHGDSLQSELVAIVVPEPDRLISWARKKFADTSEVSPVTPGNQDIIASICARSETRELIMAELTKLGKQFKFAGFEMIKNLYLESTPFSVENGLLTPSFKLKRNVAVQNYRSIISDLYGELLHKKTQTANGKSMI